MACDCETRAHRTAWKTYRLLLLLAAISLGVYIPYKYATELHAIAGLYAFLFPLSTILVVFGIALSINPAMAFRMPLVVRAGVGALAAGWIATGMLCVKTLTAAVIASPLPGLFATFQMVAQHIFLSLGVAALAVAPAAIFAQFGIEPPAPGARVEEATVRGHA